MSFFRTRKTYSMNTKNSNKAIDKLVINVIDTGQDQNHQHGDFNKLHQLVNDRNDHEFFKLLSSGHFNTDHEIPIGPDGATPLHLLAAEGRDDLMKDIFDHHQKQGIPNYSYALKMHEKSTGFTPILSAAMNGHEQCFKVLLLQSIHYLKHNSFTDDDFLFSFISDKNTMDQDSNNSRSLEQSTNVLHIIAEQNQCDILKFLSTEVTKHDKLRSVIESMLMAFDANGSTPLHFAARFGFSDMAKGLFDIAGENSSPEKINKLTLTNNLSQVQILLVPQIATKAIAKVVVGKNKVSKIGEKMVLKQNKDGWAPIHEAVEKAFKDIVILFINIAYANRQEVFTVQNSTGQTPLHLAASKGHADILELIFKYIYWPNITIKDQQGLTMLHCAAQLNKENQGKSVEILEKFFEAQKNRIKASERQSEVFIEPLTRCNRDGHNCLEVAIIKRNRPFIKRILQLEESQWKVLMRNAQITEKRTCVDTPMRKLIRYVPDLAYKVFDACFQTTPDENSPSKENKTYDFQFLEDHCHVDEWDYNRKTNPAQVNTETKQSCWERFLQKLPEISYHDTSNPTSKFTPFHTNPNIVLHNHPLTVMKDQSTLVNINEEKNLKIQICLFEHPLCRELSWLKWKQFGLAITLVPFFFYALFLGLFTWAALRNIEPARFYDAVNVSYSDGNCRAVYEKLDARNASDIAKLDHRKDTTDHALKYVIYVLLWLHVLKSILCILGVYQFQIRGRFYAEIIALILSFYYLYDDASWQNYTRLRCFGQWQAGSFGLCIAWGTLLAYMRFIPHFGLYVVMLEVIIIKFLWFAPILITLICSFAFSFYMLLQSQLPFSDIGLGWMRTAFMLMDMNYEGRVFASDGSKVIVPYNSIFPLFILYAVILAILVNNLLIGLAVGEIPTLSQLSHLYGLTIRIELLNSCEIFRLRYWFRPSIVYLQEEKQVSKNPNFFVRHLTWFRKTFIFRPHSSRQQMMDDLDRCD